eukprot:SAG11_NODE_433_length_9518_cov_11.247054_6_plen_63_part_00
MFEHRTNLYTMKNKQVIDDIQTCFDNPFDVNVSNLSTFEDKRLKEGDATRPTPSLPVPTPVL